MIASGFRSINRSRKASSVYRTRFVISRNRCILWWLDAGLRGFRPVRNRSSIIAGNRFHARSSARAKSSHRRRFLNLFPHRDSRAISARDFSGAIFEASCAASCLVVCARSFSKPCDKLPDPAIRLPCSTSIAISQLRTAPHRSISFLETPADFLHAAALEPRLKHAQLLIQPADRHPQIVDCIGIVRLAGGIPHLRFQLLQPLRGLHRVRILSSSR